MRAEKPGTSVNGSRRTVRHLQSRLRVLSPRDVLGVCGESVAERVSIVPIKDAVEGVAVTILVHRLLIALQSQ